MKNSCFQTSASSLRKRKIVRKSNSGYYEGDFNKIEGGRFEDEKSFQKKSHNAEKNERWDFLLLSGFVISV